jgi:hypothetical protein
MVDLPIYYDSDKTPKLYFLGVFAICLPKKILMFF